MTVTRVGVAGVCSNTAWGDTSVSGNYGQPPTAGNLLTMGVFSRSPDGPKATAVAGWTAGPTAAIYSSTDVMYGRFSMFWKVATGANPNPLIVFGGSAASAVIEEWAYLDTVNSLTTLSSVGIRVNDGYTAGNCYSGPVTAEQGTWIWSFCGGFNNQSKVLTWSGGSTQSLPNTYSSISNVVLGTATRTAEISGTYTPALSFSGAGTFGLAGIASLAFTPPASGFTGWGIPL